MSTRVAFALAADSCPLLAFGANSLSRSPAISSRHSYCEELAAAILPPLSFGGPASYAILSYPAGESAAGRSAPVAVAVDGVLGSSTTLYLAVPEQAALSLQGLLRASSA